MNEQPCNEAAAWTCRQTTLSHEEYLRHARNEVSSCPSSVGTLHRDNPVQSFVPGVITHHLAHQDLPITRELAVLFVDLADSTRLLVQQSPTQALLLMQRFTELVTDIAVAHCGDVKDYEGDGALLYFASIAHATRAALAMRTAFAALTTSAGQVVCGAVTIGVIGSAVRRSVALIGPTVNLAARLLKHVAPGGIIAPQAVVDRLQQDAPALARDFRLQGTCLTVRDFEERCVTAYSLPHTSGDASIQGLMVGDHNQLVIDQSRDPKHQCRDGSDLPIPDSRAQTPDAVFRCEGEYWTVSFAGSTCRLKEARGLHYLAHLLQHPYREIHVIPLIAASADLNEGPAEVYLLQDFSLPCDHTEAFSDAGDILDPQARAAYKQRLSELREELAEAQTFHDLGQSEQLATEIDFLTHELTSALGLGGRARRVGSPAERARVNVTRAIKLALRKITDHHPALGQHLATTIKTGVYCSYTPDTRLPVMWQR
jgi:class 3 adenylate cyclase